MREKRGRNRKQKLGKLLKSLERNPTGREVKMTMVNLTLMETTKVCEMMRTRTNKHRRKNKQIETSV